MTNHLLASYKTTTSGLPYHPCLITYPNLLAIVLDDFSGVRSSSLVPGMDFLENPQTIHC